MSEKLSAQPTHTVSKPHLLIGGIALVSILIGGLMYFIVFNQKPDISRFDVVKGESIYNNVCIACHVDGRFGAPKVGNHKDWAPRLAKGLDNLFHSALQGLNAMPAKGGQAQLSDEEIKDTVAFMVSKSW